MNQRMQYNSIAKKVTVDLSGHREMHVRRASGPFFASSRVPVRLDGTLRGIDRESTPPPHLFSVKGFLKHGSIGVCRRFAIPPARRLCVAGCFCSCIGDAFPVHVFLSVVISPVCSILLLRAAFAVQLAGAASFWQYGRLGYQ